MSKSFCLSFLFLLLNSCGPSHEQADIEAQNKKTILDYVDKVWNSKDLGSLEIFYSNHFTRMVNGIEVATENADLSANINVLFTAFPDMVLTVENVESCKNMVYLNWSIKATNTGIFGDHQATGKKIKINGITRFDLDEKGKIIYDNVFYNELSLLQQMGYQLLQPHVD